MTDTLAGEVLAVDAEGATKAVGPVRAVDGITLRVAPGEVYGVLGSNGAGKTTLLRMLFGLIRPSGRQNLEGLALLDGDVRPNPATR